MVHSQVQEVCKFFKTLGIDILPSNEWLKSCVQCFLQEASDLTALKSLVHEQWLLADLREVRAPSLPSSSQAKTILKGKYAVQINFVVNTSESFHKQLQKIRRPEAEINLSVDNEKDKNQESIPSNRNLKFEFTDGLTTIVGFEDQPVKSIIEPVVPGVKALLIGPIEYRKGVLFLRSGSIKLLGGEVDTLLVTNAVENVLARALGQPETKNPFRGLAVEESGDLMEDGNDDAFLQIPDVLDTSSVSADASCVIISPKRSVITIDDDDDEDFALLAAETASVAEKRVKEEPRYSSQGSSNPSTKKKQTNLNNFFPIPTSSGNNNPKATTSKSDSGRVVVSTYKSKSVVSNRGTTEQIDNLEVLDSSSIRPPRMFNLDLPRSHAHEDKIIVDVTKDTPLSDITERELDSPPRRTRQSPAKRSKDWYLAPKEVSSSIRGEPVSLELSSRLFERTAQLSVQAEPRKPPEPFPPTSFPAERIVFIEVLRSSKLSMRDRKWNMSAVIKVLDHELEVEFSAEVLNEILEVRGEEVSSKKEDIMGSSSAKEKLNQLLKERQKRVKKLSCTARIHFPSYISKAVIVEVFMQ